MKLILYVLSLFVASIAFADHHEFAGMNVTEANALQLNMCKLQPRKSMADYDKVIDAYIEWSKENDAEVYVMRATPIFGGPANDGFQYEWIDLLASSFQNSGDAWQKWLSTDEGQRLNAQWAEAADCRVSVSPIRNQYLDAEAMSGDTRIMTINWCTVNEGVSAAQLQAKHATFVANRPDDSPIKSWSIMYPGLGIRNPPGDFAHYLSFADTNGLMAYQNTFANEEGWRQRRDYNTSYADCTGENVYHVQVLNRP